MLLISQEQNFFTASLDNGLNVKPLTLPSSLSTRAMQKPSQNNFTNRTIISEDFIFPHDYSQAFTMDESKAFSNSIQGTAVACLSFTCSIDHQDEDLVCCPSSSSPAPSSAFCPSLLCFIDNNFPHYLPKNRQ